MVVIGKVDGRVRVVSARDVGRDASGPGRVNSQRRGARQVRVQRHVARQRAATVQARPGDDLGAGGYATASRGGDRRGRHDAPGRINGKDRDVRRVTIGTRRHA